MTSSSAIVKQYGPIPICEWVENLTPGQIAKDGSLMSRAFISLDSIYKSPSLTLESLNKVIETAKNLQNLQKETKKQSSNIFTSLGKVFSDSQEKAISNLDKLIWDSEILREALEAIKQKDTELSEVMERYDYMPPEYKNKLIDFAVRAVPHKVCHEIDKCNIEPEERRVEIALMLVEWCRIALCQNFDKFKIDDEDNKWRIVQAILKKGQNPYQPSEYAERYNSDLICENLAKFAFADPEHEQTVLAIEASKKRSLNV